MKTLTTICNKMHTKLVIVPGYRYYESGNVDLKCLESMEIKEELDDVFYKVQNQIIEDLNENN